MARQVDQLTAALEGLVRRSAPSTIVAPWRGDAHDDHRAVHAAAATVATRHGIQLWGGEIWTPAPATHVVDISGEPLARKRAAVEAYTTAARTLQLDAVLGLNRYRAFAATPGCVAAEALRRHVGGVSSSA